MTDSAKDTNRMPMPLEGIRVVEYGVFHAGPGATAILGDLGAEVIKIEEGTGDPERYWTEVGGLDFALPDGESLWFQMTNRNKKGICLDIESDMGRDILLHMIRDADVFLTNLRKSTKSNLGIDYHTISRVNPRIIYASVTGYGSKGPVSDLGAFDPLGQARSGMMFISGSKEPALLNLGVLDQATAIAASHAILTALLFRERNGVGQEVHVSLFSTGLWLLYANMTMTGSMSIDPNIEWDRLKNSPLRNRFCCRDGKWIIGAHHPEEKYWPIFCEATGQGALIDDVRFRDQASRINNCPELIALFDKVFLNKTRDEWMEVFVRHGLMFSPVMQNHEILKDPQALMNDYVVGFEHPTLGKIKIPGYPVHFSATRAGIRSAAPALGEHTDLIMRQMGYEEEEIQKLKREGVIR